MTDGVTRFGLMRHAITEWNKEGRIQGHSDSPLSSEGRHMAAKWAKILQHGNWSRILCSDSGRAKTTALLLNSVLALPLEIDARLREMDWGQWTGLTRQDIRERFADILERQNVADWNFTPPGGESQLQVRKRGMAALQEAALNWPGQRILTITHEGLMKCLFYDPNHRNSTDHALICMEPWRVHIMICTDCELSLEFPNAIRLDGSS
ncbi:MAG TPA: histidine phosphatase family protein [Desulfatirhabdiaceae bacterium]|nr:histidine phosphatase family protein [Desulfatirhabdiaceae bacterium]